MKADTINASIGLATAAILALTASVAGAFDVRDDETGGDCARPYNIGWTGLARDGDDRMITSSRTRSLFEVNPTTGRINSHLGSAQRQFVSDIDSSPDGTVYYNYFDEDVEGGALAMIDTSTDTVTTIGGFGTGPEGETLENGGLAVDQATLRFWAVESDLSHYTDGFVNLMEIDPLTGMALQFVRLQLDGADTGFGFDALEILPNGRFIATRAGGNSDVYEIDPSTGDVTLLDVELPPDLVGALNGAESGVSADADTVMFVTDSGELVEIDLAAGTSALIGDNARVYGRWNAGRKSCKLIRDLADRIDIQDDGLRLNYAGHSQTGQIGANGGLRIFGADVIVRNVRLRYGGNGIQVLGRRGTVNGCRVGGGSAFSGAFVAAAKATIRDCVFSNAMYGVFGQSTSLLRVIDTRIHNASADGIFLTEMVNVRIRRTEISGSAGNGVAVSDGSSARIADGEIEDSGGAGVHVTGTSAVVLDDVEFEDNAGGDIVVEAGSEAVGDEAY